MLIELINTENVELDNSQVQCAISNLLNSYREGKHIIISNEAFLKSIITNKNFGSIIKNAAQSILQRVRELYSLKQQVIYYCVVDFNSKKISKIQSPHNENYFTVSYDFFSDSSRTQATKLLCEDSRDGGFYRIISRYFKYKSRLQHLKTAFELENGGGANILMNFQKIKNENRLCFCILDSDKQHPNGALGSTAASFSEEITTPFCHYHILASNEIEALIPLPVISEVIHKNRNSSQSHNLTQLEALVSHNPNIKKYFDHKNGITLIKARNLDERYHSEFWTQAFRNAPNFARGRCIRRMSCDCSPPCNAVGGLGNSLVAKSVLLLETKTHIKLEETLSNALKDEWMQIGRLLFSWGCSTGAARTS